MGETNARGSILAFPHSYVMWKPKSLKEVTIDSLQLVELTNPKIEILLIGQGAEFFKPLDPALQKHFKAKGIAVEAMDTVSAVSTFNILNAEDRSVCAALLKLDPSDPDDDYWLDKK
jgi:NADH dehydrogenase [ubiquinone] 1 alpha subcomplex assembly factor 3